jgi:hypothetical protein
VATLDVIVSRGGRASPRALAEGGDAAAVRAALLELVAAGCVRYGACAAPVVVDRDAAGKVRVRARCSRHGGESTGARTLEGRARLADAGRKGADVRWSRWRAERGYGAGEAVSA